MYTCRWGLEICLCFQKDLEIHLYPEKESKTMLKPDLVNTTKLIGFSHCCFFQELRLACSPLPKPVSAMEQQESWVAAG